MNISTFSAQLKYIPIGVGHLLISVRDRLKIYSQCLLNLRERSILGFSRNMSAISQWYEVMGLRILKTGGWGYSFDGNFGSPNKSFFAVQHLSYGYLWNWLSGGCYSFVSAFLFLIITIFLLAYSKGLVIGLGTNAVLALCPIFIVGYFVNSKPENLAWAFVLLLFASIRLKMSIWVCGALLLAISYISLTAGLIALAMMIPLASVYGFHYFYSAIPATIKIAVDILVSLFGGDGIGILRRITGSSRRSKHDCTKETNVYKRGIMSSPRRLCVLMALALPTILFYLDGSNLLYVGVCSILLFLENCYLFRFADNSSFIRLALVINILAIADLQSPYAYGPILIFFIKQPWIDETVSFKKHGHEQVNRLEVIRKDRWITDSMNSFLAAAKDGDRVVAEYDGEINRHRLRYFIYYLERYAFDRGVEVCPHEMTAAWYPEWYYNHYSKIRKGVSFDQVQNVLMNCGATHALVFTKKFSEFLEDNGCKMVAELKPDDESVSEWFSCNGNKRIDVIRMLSIPSVDGIVTMKETNQGLSFSKMDNHLIINHPEEAGDIIIRYRYDKRWRAYQDEEELTVEAYSLNELPFMKLQGARLLSPVTLKYTGVVSCLR